MSSHVVPITGAEVPGVRTGYESIVAMRASKRFIRLAELDGEVIDITKKHVVVRYQPASKSKTVQTGKPRIEKITLKQWTTKEESGSCYTHKIVPNLTKGTKFVKGDTLAYDETMFGPDIFNLKRVIYKSSVDINVAMMEDIQTFEDSCAVSGKLYKKLKTTTTKVKSIIVDASDVIVGLVNIGDVTEHTTPLFSISDPTIMRMKGLDKEAIATLQKIKGSTPKAKVTGKVTNIKVFYNCEKENLSKTLLDIIEVSDKKLVHENDGKATHTGKVNNTYSVNGIRLLPDQVEIKIYIDVTSGLGVGDKVIFANQLKSTVGEVFSDPMTGMSGTEIEAVFSTKSIAARIVSSPSVIATTNSVLEALKDRAVEMYFN